MKPVSAPRQDFINLVEELHQWDLNVLGHLVDLLLDEGFLPCLLDDLGPLHFDCIDVVLNKRVRNLLRFPSGRHLNDLSSK